MYVLQGGMFRLAYATVAVAARRPGRFARALWLALRFTRRSDRPAVWHFAYLAEACRLLPWLSAAHVQHIHAHFGTNSTEVALFAHLLTGLGYSFTVHGPDEFDKPEFIRLPEKIRRAQFVVAISSFTRSQLLRWVEETHWPKIKVVHCGLGRDFLDAPRPVSEGCRRLVCVGRLSAQKGQLLLLNAASLLVREGVAFELVLAGDGEMRAEIEKSISALGLSAVVRITGWLSNEKVRDEILAARALVLPSFAEGLPVVMMEAMALQRPVLATYVSGIPELVRHGEEGWLFPAGSVEDLAAAMRECIEAPLSEIARRGARARERALARHDVEKEAKLLAELFAAR
jgi:colanic acid/amylovoran biosynthesis glycosyltransferase